MEIQFPAGSQSLAIETGLRGVSPRHEDREKGTFNRFVRKAEQGHTKLKRPGRGHDPTDDEIGAEEGDQIRDTVE
jgi:hypothetical protein